MGCQQTACRCEHSSLAVTLNASTLKYEVETVYVFSLYLPIVVELAVQGIVEVGRKLLAPAVEAEIE